MTATPGSPAAPRTSRPSPPIAPGVATPVLARLTLHLRRPRISLTSCPRPLRYPTAPTSSAGSSTPPPETRSSLASARSWRASPPTIPPPRPSGPASPTTSPSRMPRSGVAQLSQLARESGILRQGVARSPAGTLRLMITRRARPRFQVAVEVTHAGGWRVERRRRRLRAASRCTGQPRGARVPAGVGDPSGQRCRAGPRRDDGPCRRPRASSRYRVGRSQGGRQRGRRDVGPGRGIGRGPARAPPSGRGSLVVARRVAVTVISRQRGGPRSRQESGRRISRRPRWGHRARGTPAPDG